MILLGIIGGQEIFVILLIVLILFGGKKIPELMRGMGKGLGEFNKAKKDVEDGVNNMVKDEGQKDSPVDKTKK